MYYLLNYPAIILFIVINSFCWHVTLAGNGDPPEVDLNVRTQFKIPIATKPFKLSCPIKSDDESTILRWSKDGEEISETEWSSSPYRLLNFNRDLKIRNPQISDSGHYKCMAINGFGHKEVEFTIQVYDLNLARNEDPNELITLSEYSSSPIWLNRNAIDTAIKTPLRLQSGALLTLRCPASGNPLPKIYWSKNGINVNIELVNPISAKFLIHNVKVSDSGIYSCRLENTHGSLEADFHVLVSNEDKISSVFKPKEHYDDVPHSGTFGNSALTASGVLSQLPPQPIIDQPYNSTVRAGHTAQFQCKVQWRKDAPTIRWLRKIGNFSDVKSAMPNATILHINNMHLLVLEQKNEAIQVETKNDIFSNEKLISKSFVNKLLIQNVQQHDSGRYFCVVSNTAGQFVYRSAYLNVVEAIRFSPLANTTNIFIVVIIVFVLTIVTVAVVWLCCHGAVESSVKSVTSSLAANSAKQQFSSTSSTSSSTSSKKYPKSLGNNCADAHYNAVNIFADVPPPPPQIPLPKAPFFSPQLYSTNGEIFNRFTNFNHSSTIANGLGSVFQQQKPITHAQHEILDDHFNHHSQTHSHHNANSPLLYGGHSHVFNNISVPNGGIGDLLYPSATLDHRYLNHQRVNQISNQNHQHILHRTKAEDEMSRLSSHIYDMLAINSPFPPHANSQPASPTPIKHNFNRNTKNSFQQQTFQHKCNQKCNVNNYAVPPTPPLPTSLPPPYARPTTPAANACQVNCCESENLMGCACRNIQNNQSIKSLHYFSQQQQKNIQRNVG